MQELDLTPKQITIKMGEEKHLVRIPSHREAIEFGTSLQACSVEGQADLIAEYFEKLGLSREVSERFDSKGVKLLLEELTGIKKN